MSMSNDKATNPINSINFKSNMIERLVFQSRCKHEGLVLDESQLKKLNTIVSNLPFQLIKSSYDKASYDRYLTEKNRRVESHVEIVNDESVAFQKEEESLERFNNQLKDGLVPQGDKTLSAGSSSTPSSAATNCSNTTITIHVNDEAKNIKKDFTCPKDLLLTEMKYFNQSLKINNSGSSDSSSTSILSKKSLDDIDISVHCDINIFDWLMRYVKRNHPHLVDAMNAMNSEESGADGEKEKSSSSPSDPIGYKEPKLELTNCISILLSSDFLIISDLVDKCVLFIAKNLETLLQMTTPSGTSIAAFGGLNETLLAKLAACVSLKRLLNLTDKKDKIKSKLFQRRIEFITDTKKYKDIFEKSAILNEWKNDRYKFETTDEGGDNLVKDGNSSNYLEHLYELENDASSLFKCKICSKLMTRQQSIYLRCELSIVSTNGQTIYLHIPDASYDQAELFTKILLLLKEKLKSNWQTAYWYLWSLIKCFKCKKCNDWFRLIDIDKCRVNINTKCVVHDSKHSSSDKNKPESSLKSSCTCIHSDHQLDLQSALKFYSNSPIATYTKETPINREVSSLDIYTEPPQTVNSSYQLNKYVQFVIDCFDKKRAVLLVELEESGGEDSKSSPMSINEHIEHALRVDNSKSKKAKSTMSIELPIGHHITSHGGSNKKSHSYTVHIPSSFQTFNYFMDSITNKQVSLLKRGFLNLIRVAQLFQHDSSSNSNNVNNNNASSTSLTMADLNHLHNNLDIVAFMKLISRVESVTSVFGCLEALPFLKIENKQNWDMNKGTRLNQDNQRESDLKRFREISKYIIKAKLLDEMCKKMSERAPISNILLVSLSASSNSINTTSSQLNNIPGGFYCRIENEWRQRNNL